MEKNTICHPVTSPECPVSPLANYELNARIVANNAPADGTSQNVVVFYLTYGGIGVSGTILISDHIPTHPPVSRTTGTDGLYTAYFTSSNPGSFNVSAQLRSDPSVSTSETITFTPVVTYPVFLGPNRVSTPPETYFLGLESFFGPLVITAGHRYSIRGIPTSGLTFSECPNSYVLNESSQQCRLDITRDFTLLAVDSLTPIRALNSGVGRELHSPGYYFNGYGAQEFTVDVYDLGPE